MRISPIMPAAAQHPRDSLGCFSSDLSRDQVLCTETMVFRRKAAAGLHESRVETPAADRGLLIGISLVNGHRRRVMEGGRYRNVFFRRGDIYIRDFDSDFSADFDGYFDFCLIELTPDFWKSADQVVDQPCGSDLGRVMALDDPVLHHLAQALLPSLAQPNSICPMFAEQLSTVISAHLLRRHGVKPGDEAGKVVALAPMAIRRAQEMLVEGEEGRVTIAGIASELGLSRNHFFMAFREATGVTPYQWLLNQRIDHARRLLRTTELSLAEIALHCGFADQSHFTRVFGRIEGVSPGRWRERAR